MLLHNKSSPVCCSGMICEQADFGSLFGWDCRPLPWPDPWSWGSGVSKSSVGVGSNRSHLLGRKRGWTVWARVRQPLHTKNLLLPWMILVTAHYAHPGLVLYLELFSFLGCSGASQCDRVSCPLLSWCSVCSQTLIQQEIPEWMERSPISCVGNDALCSLEISLTSPMLLSCSFRCSLILCPLETESSL